MELPVLCITLQQVYLAQVIFLYMLFQSSSHAGSNNGAEILLIDKKFELFDICCGEGGRGENGTASKMIGSLFLGLVPVA
jgi:hypothetical protein